MAVREVAAGTLAGWSHARSVAFRSAVQRLLDVGRFPEAVAAARRIVEEGLAAGEDAYPGAAYDLALAHLVLGRAMRMGGAAEASLEPFEEARRRFQKLADGGNPAAARMAGKALAGLGDGLTALGRLDDAARAYEASFRRAEELDDPRQAAVAKGQLGTVRLHQGRYREALEAHEEARETFEGLGEPGAVATAWHQVGLVHQGAGDYDAAEEAYRKSLKIEVERGDRSGEASTLGNLGALAFLRERPEEAVRLLRQVADIYRGLDDLAHEGRARYNITIPLIELRRRCCRQWGYPAMRNLYISRVEMRTPCASCTFHGKGASMVSSGCGRCDRHWAA